MSLPPRQFVLWRRVLPLLAALPGLAVLEWQIASPAHQRADPGLYYEYAGMALGRPARLDYIRWKTHPVGEPPVDRLTKFAGPQVPYRDFPMEYPPGALALFLPARLITDDYPSFATLFQAEMALMLLATALLTGRIAARLSPTGTIHPLKAALVWSAAVYAFSLLLVQEYDAAAALAVAGAVYAALCRRWALAGLLLGIGGAIKLWPLLLFPPLAMRIWSERRFPAVFIPAMAAAAGFLIPHAVVAAFAGPAVLDYLRYHAERGLHMESLLGNAAILYSRVFHLPAWTEFEYGTFHFHTPGWADPAVKWSNRLLLAGYAASLAVTAWAFLRARGRPDVWNRIFVAGGLSAVAVPMAAAKVLSVQYLIWLWPLALVLPGRAGTHVTLVWLGLAALGRLIFRSAHDLRELEFAPHLLVLARNLGLLALAVMAARISLSAAEEPVEAREPERLPAPERPDERAGLGPAVPV